MDPIRPLVTPIAEVRAQAPVQVDSYGESWQVIDGVDTKIPNLQKAKAILAHQDAERVKIRAAMDEHGLRDDNEIVKMVTEDGIEYEAELVPPMKTGYMTIGDFPFEQKGVWPNINGPAEYDPKHIIAERTKRGLITDKQLQQLTGITPPPVVKLSALARVYRKVQSWLNVAR